MSIMVKENQRLWSGIMVRGGAIEKRNGKLLYVGMNLHLSEMHSYPGCYVCVVSMFLSSKSKRGVC